MIVARPIPQTFLSYKFVYVHNIAYGCGKYEIQVYDINLQVIILLHVYLLCSFFKFQLIPGSVNQKTQNTLHCYTMQCNNMSWLTKQFNIHTYHNTLINKSGNNLLFRQYFNTCLKRMALQQECHCFQCPLDHVRQWNVKAVQSRSGSRLANVLTGSLSVILVNGLPQTWGQPSPSGARHNDVIDKYHKDITWPRSIYSNPIMLK